MPRPSGTELKALKAIEELVAADHIAVSQQTGTSSAYADYLLRNLAKNSFVERMGKGYRLTEEGRKILREKRQIQEKLERLEEGIGQQLGGDLAGMMIAQIIENRLKIRAIVELIAQKGILTWEELRTHLATVIQRDWNEELDKLLPPELAQEFKMQPEEQDSE